MQIWYHNVGMMFFAGRFNGLYNVRLVQPSHSRLFLAGRERFGRKPVESHQSDPQTVAIEDQGLVSLLGIASAAKVWKFRFFQQGQLLEKSRFPKVAGMIIRQVYRRKVFFQKRNAARRSAERIRLENLLSSLDDRAFQVADGNVRLLKNRGEFRKGIRAVDNGMAGSAVEHNVAGKNQPDRLLPIIGRQSRIRPDNCRQQKQ